MIFLKTVFTLSSFVMLSLAPVQASLGEEPVKPLVRLVADSQEKITRQFEDFQTIQSQRRENIFTYRALLHYAEDLGIRHDFSIIQSWVINTDSPEIMLPLAAIAQLISIKTTTEVTEEKLQAYINESQKASKRAFLLGLIAHNTPALSNSDDTAPRHLNFAELSGALESYDRPFVTSHYPHETSVGGGNLFHPHAGMPGPLAPKNMDTFYELLAVKLGYKMPQEIKTKVIALQKENDAKLQRVILTHDFKEFTRKGNSAPTSMMGINYQIPDPITAAFMGGMPTADELLPQDMDITAALTTYTLQSVFDSNPLDATRYAPHAPFFSCGQTDANVLEHVPAILDVRFQDGLIMRGDTALTLSAEATGAAMMPSSSGEHTEIWALDLDGKMRINSRDPSCALVTNHHHLFSGISAACAGHISVKDGKITDITNSSGHYMPSTLNLLFAIKYLDNFGLFAEGATSNAHTRASQNSLTEMRRLAQLVEVVPGEET